MAIINKQIKQMILKTQNSFTWFLLKLGFTMYPKINEKKRGTLLLKLALLEQ